MSQYQLSKFLRRSLMIFIVKGFRTIILIFIVISTTFQAICPPALFRWLSNSGTFTEFRNTSFIEFTGVTCSDFVSHNRVQVLSIPVLLFTCSQDSTYNWVQQTPEESRGTYQPKCCGNNYEDEDNSPKTLNDKSQYQLLKKSCSQFSYFFK